MSNYVWNKVICSKETLSRYFIDPTSPCDKHTVDAPCISFNRLLGLHALNEYDDTYSVDIYYELGFAWIERSDEYVEIKFCTRWKYPIKAILKALELAHDTIWYAVEENHVYVSKFIWQENVCEYIAPLGDEYFNWEYANDAFIEKIEDFDDGTWYYLAMNTPTWRLWENTDRFERYFNLAAYEIKAPDL